MQILSSLLFGISASLDTLLIGFSYGMRRIHIPFRQNLLIGLITFWGSFFSMGLGTMLGPLLPERITVYAGSGLLIFVGCYYLIKYLVYRKTHPSLAESKSASQQISGNKADATLTATARDLSSLTFTDTLLLGIMLSMNNIGIGFGTGMAGLMLIPTLIFIFLLSLIFMALGNRMGERKSFTFTESMADFISGILLICLGITQLIL